MIRISLSAAIVILMLSVNGGNVLHARDAGQDKDLMNKVPLKVAGVIILHGAAIGTSLLLTEPDTASRGKELGQDDTFSLYETMYQVQANSRKTDFYGLSYGRGKILRPWLAGKLQGGMFSVRDDVSDTEGLTAGGGVQFQYPQGKNWYLFYDCDLGVSWTFAPFPPQGTRLNFISFFGLGAALKLHPGTYWQFGYRHVHISNTGLFVGDEHNPGFDSNGVFSSLLISY